MPPFRWASATTCIARVVLPELSGPKISTIRPRGRPPIPRAKSSDRAPVEMDSIPRLRFSPMRMTDPLPNCFSIWLRAMSSALSRSIFPFASLRFVVPVLVPVRADRTKGV